MQGGRVPRSMVGGGAALKIVGSLVQRGAGKLRTGEGKRSELAGKKKRPRSSAGSPYRHPKNPSIGRGEGKRGVGRLGGNGQKKGLKRSNDVLGLAEGEKKRKKEGAFDQKKVGGGRKKKKTKKKKKKKKNSSPGGGVGGGGGWGGGGGSCWRFSCREGENDLQG